MDCILKICGREMQNEMNTIRMTKNSIYLLVWIFFLITQVSQSRTIQNSEVLSTGSDVHIQSDEGAISQDTRAYTMRLSKLDYTLEQLNKRIESIETKLTRLQVKFELKMEKIEELVSEKEIKEEFASDQLSRQLDNVADKLINKMAFMETKMGLKIDNINTRFERSDRNLQNSIDNVIDKLIKTDDSQMQAESRMWTHISRADEITNSITDMKTYLKEEINNVMSKKLQELDNKIETGFQEMDQEFEIGQTMIGDLKTVLLKTITENENNTNKLETKYNLPCDNRGRGGQARSDSQYATPVDEFASETNEKLHNLTNTMSEALRMGEKRFEELDVDVEIYTKKVLNAYYELIKNTKGVETLLKSSMDNGNQTRLEIKDGFRKLHQQLRPLTGLEFKVEQLVKPLQTSVNDLISTLDKNFASLLVAQNTFIASCHRIQSEEPQIENRIKHLLQEITENLQNGNMASGGDTTLNSLVNNQNSDVDKTLGDLMWILLNVGNQTRKDVTAIMDQVFIIRRILTRQPSCRCMIQNGDWNSLADACETLHSRPRTTDKPHELNAPKANKSSTVSSVTKRRERLIGMSPMHQFTQLVNPGITLVPPVIKQRTQNMPGMPGFLSDQQNPASDEEKDHEVKEVNAKIILLPNTEEKVSMENTSLTEGFLNKHSKNGTIGNFDKNENSQEDDSESEEDDPTGYFADDYREN